MKSMLMTLSCVGVVAVSCGNKNDDSNSSGPGLTQPGIGLVAPEGFKNTATSGKEVGAKLKETGVAAKNTHFGPSTSESTTHNRLNILTSATVQSFLAGDILEADSYPPSTPEQKPSLTLTDGASCDTAFSGLDAAYKSTADSLKSTADILVSLDQEDLPDSITRGAPNDQFAVTYTIDLSKAQADSDNNKLSFLGRDGSKSGSQKSTDDSKVSGLVILGAGANDNAAVLSIGMDATSTSDDSSGTFKGGLAIGAYAKEQRIQLSSDGSVNVTTKDNKGNPLNIHTSYTAAFALQAGATPSVGLSVSGKSNANINPEAKSADGSSLSTSNEDHSMAAELKIAKLANKDVSMTYSLSVDSKTQKGEITLVNDATGTCVVKNPNSKPNVTTTLN